MRSAKDIRKDESNPFFKFEGPPLPRPHTLPVFRVVLPHTEASGQRLFRRSVHISKNRSGHFYKPAPRTCAKLCDRPSYILQEICLRFWNSNENSNDLAFLAKRAPMKFWVQRHLTFPAPLLPHENMWYEMAPRF